MKAVMVVRRDGCRRLSIHYDGKAPPELSESLKELKEQVAAAEGDASSLKVWAMQDLGVQAASNVLSASDPLKTLRDICQNFPFKARTLSKMAVNRDVQSEVQHLQQSMYGPGFSGLFLNGLPLPIRENDFFGLLQTIQREMHTVDALASLQLPSKTISRLVSLPAPTASLRITWDHPALIYLNDVEKDKRYEQFSPRLGAMLQVCKPSKPSTHIHPFAPHTHSHAPPLPFCVAAATDEYVGPDVLLPA